MQNPFTQEEKALLASVLPKLADKLVPDKNPQVFRTVRKRPGV